jgi:uncharacterized membrane protein YgdD (TMEM256/DUF423 family)
MLAEFGKDGGPTIAILSEYDALPGVGHACGHNIIATSGLGAALALSKLGARLPGRVRYLGTPAEERFGGKEIIAREGAFDGADAAMMIHPSNLNLVTMPCIAISEVEVTYHGRAAHASAMPYRGLNALDAVVTAYQSIAQLRQHIKQTERIHGIITEGGLAANIVPERASCRFYVRAPTSTSSALKKRVHACFEAAALSTGCTAEIMGQDRLSRPQDQLADGRRLRAQRQALGREFFPVKEIPPASRARPTWAMSAIACPRSIRCWRWRRRASSSTTRNSRRWAASDKGDAAVIDGAKALAHDRARPDVDPRLLDTAKADFDATADISKAALAKLHEKVRAIMRHPHGAARLRLRMNVWLLIAAINGFLAVAAGAFGAHGLQGRLDAHAHADLRDRGALSHVSRARDRACGAGDARLRQPARTQAAAFFLAGIVLFSGSLYLLALTGMRGRSAFVTPFGGLAFLDRLGALAWAATKVA